MKSLISFVLLGICICIPMVCGFSKKHPPGDKYNDGNKYVNDEHKYKDGGRKYAPKGPKFECRSDKDCHYKEVCSGGFCNPRCGPCHEYDFTIADCRNLCTRKARCHKNTCICPKCRPMSGYDAFWDCTPPKVLRSICHKDGYGKKKRGCNGYDCDGKKNGGYHDNAIRDKDNGAYRRRA